MTKKRERKIVTWLKKNAKLVSVSAFFAAIIPYTSYIKGLQKDVDEVRYSRELNTLEKKHSEDIRNYQHEIEEFRQKNDNLREENLNLRQEVFKLMEESFNNSNHVSVKEIINEK